MTTNSLTPSAAVPRIDAAGIVARLDEPDVTAAYERDRFEARRAGGSAAQLQGKTADTDGVIRFTAPSVVFERAGQRLVAGGFQPVEAYDVLVANLDPSLVRQQPAGDTVAATRGLRGRNNHAGSRGGDGPISNEPPDIAAAEVALLELTAAGVATRTPLGDGALWRLRPAETHQRLVA